MISGQFPKKEYLVRRLLWDKALPKPRQRRE
jgi:hypothetical protein